MDPISGCNASHLLSAWQSADASNICQFTYHNVCMPWLNNTSSIVDPVVPPHHRVPTEAEIWGYGTLAVLLISLGSVVGVLFLPIMKAHFYHQFLMGMVGLGVGCLCGSAIFHLIPQAFHLSSDTPEELERFLGKAAVIVAAICFFLLAERISKMAVTCRKRRREKQKAAKTMSAATLNMNSVTSLPISEKEEQEHHDHAHRHSHANIDPKELSDNPIKTVAWMIIAGDGFVDGISVGAAFSISIWNGISLSVAVLCEEVPHELGDLAILLNSGMSLRKALAYNFLSGCTCFLGLVVGILLGDLPDAGPWIFAVSAGMFLYISLVHMLPEMTEAAEEATERSTKEGVIMLIIQSVGLLAGFVVIFVLVRYGGNIDITV
ncbi:metal cation symporter ZIP14-like [Paramacrobiotus metropolitanus]|uniref:metal cation symporter ZIP14-like n=1 Tax=Paramacrobiotus metropolitanus TaxID=2943436 RepID=UPI002445F0FC|nr:metal cation symporter ZIP14-like [Paramacrobiotus metropolitanus]